MIMRHRTGRAAGLASIVAAVGLLLATPGVVLAQEPVLSTCTIDAGDVADLKVAIATALGFDEEDEIAVPIVIVPTFNDNLGQFDSEGEESGIIVCINEDETSTSSTGTSESDPFPGSGTADIIELQQSSYVLIDVDGTRSIRICQSDEISDCIEATEDFFGPE